MCRIMFIIGFLFGVTITLLVMELIRTIRKD